MFLIALLYMLFASSFTVGKIALAYATPLLLIGVRMMMAGTLLLGWQLAHHGYRKLYTQSRERVGLLMQLILTHIFGAYVLEFWGLQYLSSSKSALIYSLSPFITALFAYFLLGERLTSRKIAGLSLGFGGIVLLLLSGSVEELASGGVGFLSLAELAMVASVICSVYGWIVIKKLTHHHTYPLVSANGIAMFFGGVMSFVLSLMVDGWPTIAHDTAHKVPHVAWVANTFGSYLGADVALFLFWVLFLVIITNVICFNLYGWLLRHYSATLLSFFGFLCPLFTALFGILFLNEAITLVQCLSFAGVVAGLSVFYQDELKKLY